MRHFCCTILNSHKMPPHCILMTPSGQCWCTNRSLLLAEGFTRLSIFTAQYLYTESLAIFYFPDAMYDLIRIKLPTWSASNVHIFLDVDLMKPIKLNALSQSALDAWYLSYQLREEWAFLENSCFWQNSSPGHWMSEMFPFRLLQQPQMWNRVHIFMVKFSW